MHSLLAFIKQWALLCAILFGSATYLLFTNVDLLRPAGIVAGPLLLKAMPVLIFAMLYVTFCRIRIDDMRPRNWHFALQGIRTLLSFLLVLGVIAAPSLTVKIVLEGLFVCVICPTAASAPVITEKLGGGIATMTIYTLVANCFTSVIIPLFFPLAEKEAHISFTMAFFLVFKRVVTVLVVPLCLALLTRKLAPRIAGWLKARTNLPFYLWAVNLAIVMGLAMHTTLHAGLHGIPLLLLLVLPLPIALLLFSIGKVVGARWGERVSGGQALGQKNTIVGIWLTLTFLHPVAVIAPCAYVVWQNLINTWQLWCKEKYGAVKW